MSIEAVDRLAQIEHRVRAAGRVKVAELAVELDVSEMTIRRDLDLLAEQGMVQRIRGGAVALGPQPFAERFSRQARAKDRIAAKLADLVGDGGAIGVDASSTLQRLAGHLGRLRELTVVTNGQDTFQALQDVPGVTVLLTGGQLDPRTGSLVGPLATRAAREVLLRRLFVSAAALDPRHGTSEATLEEAEVKLALADVAAEVVVAVDSSKLGQRAPARAPASRAGRPPGHRARSRRRPARPLPRAVADPLRRAPAGERRGRRRARGRMPSRRDAPLGAPVPAPRARPRRPPPGAGRVGRRPARHRPPSAAPGRVRLHRRRRRGRADAWPPTRRAFAAHDVPAPGAARRGRGRPVDHAARPAAAAARWCWRPTGFTRIADPDGELAVARAAARAGLPYTLSTLSTRSIEEVAAVGAGRRWFQVYVWRDRGLVARDDRAGGRRRLRGAGAHGRHGGARPSRAGRAPGVHAAAQDRARHAGRRRPAPRLDLGVRAVRADPLRQRRGARCRCRTGRRA